MAEELTLLRTPMTDVDFAAETKAKVGEHLRAIAALMSGLYHRDMRLSFTIAPPDVTGFCAITLLEITKKVA